MRLMWFQLKKMWRRPALLYIVLAYACSLGYLACLKIKAPITLAEVVMKGMNNGFLSLGLGLFVISYLLKDDFKKTAMALEKKHSSYVMSRLAALELLSVLAVLVYFICIAALSPLILHVSMDFGDPLQLLRIFIFYVLAHISFVSIMAFFVSLFRQTIYALYALAVLYFLPVLATYIHPDISQYIVLPYLYHNTSLALKPMLFNGAFALLYAVIAILLYRVVNRR